MLPVDLIAQYHKHGILIDTAPSVLLAVGLYEPRRIRHHKRTGAYTENDFKALEAFVNRFERRVATPHILTEADNLIRQGFSAGELGNVVLILKALIEDIVEVPFESVRAARDKRYQWLGLSDCATLLAAPETLVLTADARLYSALMKAGRNAVNFTHLRDIDLD